MKNMVKRVCGFIVCALVLTLCLTLFGCDENPINNVMNQADKQVVLETVCHLDEINFDNPHVEICVYSDENYYFSNRNEDFFTKFTAFLKNKKISSQHMNTTADDYFYVLIKDDKNYASFSIYENDIVGIVDATGSYFYYCADVYNEFEKTFGSFLEQNRKYCRSAQTPILLMHEYAIYDKNNNIIESDCIDRTPYLFYNSGIVHLWIQGGTGKLTRCAKFYDIEKGLISPVYYGQTDYFGSMVCAADSSQVLVYEMFSGEQLYCFNDFEKPLADCIENIYSAFFTKDGTQIVVEYLNAEFELEKQIFDIPKDDI